MALSFIRRSILFSAIIFQVVLCCFAVSSERIDYRKDLVFLYDSLKMEHRCYFNYVTQEDALAELESILSESDAYSDVSFYFALLRLAALAHDSHTVVSADERIMSQMSFLPLSFDEFSGSWIVVAAGKGYENLLGEEIESINGVSLTEIVRLSSSLIPSDNDIYLKNQLKNSYLSIADFYKAIGIPVQDGAMELRFSDGKVAAVRTLSYDEYLHSVFSFLREDLPDTLNPDSYYSAMLLPDRSALLINYHLCAEMESFSFSDFVSAVRLLIEKNGYSSIIIDLRYNSGGNSEVINPLIAMLKEVRVNLDYDLYVLIGEGTFSSAVLNAISLQSELGATLVGRPTGGNAGHYGELNSSYLPSSGLKFFWSTKYFDMGPSSPVIPDILIERNVEDYIHGVDTDLKALGVLS